MRDDSQRRFLVQGSITALLRQCFQRLQHCCNIATLFSAQNRRCESPRVTSPLLAWWELKIANCMTVAV